MHKIEQTSYGYRLMLGGVIGADEMSQWLDEAQQFLTDQQPGFGIFVDMRTLKPLPEEAQKKMESGQRLCKHKGMMRSVVILNSALTTMQFKRIAKISGIYEWERYINASVTPDWEKAGLDWITSATDPDTKAEGAIIGS